jgi:hypothetical protein
MNVLTFINGNQPFAHGSAASIFAIQRAAAKPAGEVATSCMRKAPRKIRIKTNISKNIPLEAAAATALRVAHSTGAC